MTDPGLSDRLRQRSRRAGLMVGISMALAIVLCIGVFAAIYAGLSPWLSDIIPIAAPAATQVASNAPVVNSTSAGIVAPTAPPDAAIAAAPTQAPAPTIAAEPTATAEPDDFAPTHQIRSGDSINLRPEPSTANNPIRALSPATPLMFLGDESPSPDGTWMRFETEEGDDGWVREIDTEPYEP